MGLFGALGSFFGGKKTTTTQSLDPRSQAYVDALRQQAQGASNVALAGPNPGGSGLFGGMLGQFNQMQNGVGGAPGNSWFTGPQTMSIGDQAAAFFNPYMSNVVDATKSQFDQLRNQALTGTSQQATLGGAYGGSRAAVLAGSRLGQLDLGQANTISNLLNSGYQNALGQGTAYAEQQRQLREQQLQEPLFRQQAAQQFLNLGMGPVGYSTTQSTSGGGFGDLLKGAAGLGSLYLGAGGKLPFGLGGGGGGGNANTTPGYFPMPTSSWQPPQWNPQYRGLFG